MNNTIVDRFYKLMDVNTPVIYIQDYDFVRVDELIGECTVGYEKVEWNPATKVTDFESKNAYSLTYSTLAEFLNYEYLFNYKLLSKPRCVILKNIHDCIEEPEIKTYLLLIAQRRLYSRERYDTTVIIVSPKVAVPHEIEKYVSFLEIPFPDPEELNVIIDLHLDVNNYKPEKLSSEDRRELLQSLKGMTAFEVDRVIDMAMSKDGSLCADDKSMILEQKKQMVKNSGLLELISVNENIGNIGGLAILKEYLTNKAKVIKELVKANEYGVPTPKGVFIVGMPGCGKSLCAKAAASLFGAPLLKLDMGSMLGKYVGDSESNLRRAIKIAEAAAPCILWIDEIEKGFSGVGGNNDIMTRMFGYFLSWLQDKESSVYVIATANNADSLPPELKRKGRFDEIFCVNLPKKDERKEIFKVHLKKRHAPITESTDDLLVKTKGFNGADIEAVVCEAKEKVFLKELDDKNGKKVDGKEFEKLMIEIAASTNSISKSCKKQIDAMKDVFKENSFTDASFPKNANDVAE